MSRRGSRASSRRADRESASSDSYWPPTSPRALLLLIAAYALVAVIATACFLGAFVAFGGWRLLDDVSTWVRWTACGSVVLVVLLIVSGYVAARRR